MDPAVVGSSVVVRALGTTVGVGMPRGSSGGGGGGHCTPQSLAVLALTNAGGDVGMA